MRLFLPILALGVLALRPPMAGAQGSIAGTVYDSLGRAGPLPHAVVVLVERSRYVTSDSRGRFVIDSVPAGRYSLAVLHPSLDSLDLEVTPVPVEVTANHRSTVTLTTPSAGTVYTLLCARPQESHTGVVVGTVRNMDDGSPLAGVVVLTDWSELAIKAAGATRQTERAEATADSAGRYVLCGVPTDVTLELRAGVGDQVAGLVRMPALDRLIRRVDFAVRRTGQATRNVATQAAPVSATPSTGSASVSGTVRTAGHAVPNATVHVLGTTLSTRTDSAGWFRITGVPAGTRTLEVMAIGWSPTDVVTDLGDKATRELAVELHKQAQVLDPVTVREVLYDNSLMARDGFKERQRWGLGAFLTSADIAKHPYLALGDVLGAMRGVRIAYGDAGYPLPVLRGGTTGSCIPNFFLNGAPFHVDGAKASRQVVAPFSDLTQAAPVESIKGVEVYSSAMVPAEYDRTGSTACGSIVIWTR